MSEAIKVVCAWCNATISEGRRDRQGEVSHGMCQRCANAKRITFQVRGYDDRVSVDAFGEILISDVGITWIDGWGEPQSATGVTGVHIAPLNW